MLVDVLVDRKHIAREIILDVPLSEYVECDVISTSPYDFK